MAEARRDDRRGRGGWKRGGGRPQLRVDKREYGEAKIIGPDQFEVGVNVSVYFGKYVAQDAMFQYIVDGAPYGEFVPVDIDGRAFAKIRFSGKAATLSTEVKKPFYDRDRGENRELRLRVQLPSLEAPKAPRKLELVATSAEEEAMTIILRRVGRNGKSEEGSIGYRDFKPKGEKLLWNVDTTSSQGKDDDDCMVEMPLYDRSRVTTFYLPDDPEVKLQVSMPAKKKAVAPKADPEPEKESLAQKLKKFREGENPGESLRERIQKKYEKKETGSERENSQASTANDEEESDEVRAEKARVINDEEWTL